MKEQLNQRILYSPDSGNLQGETPSAGKGDNGVSTNDVLAIHRSTVEARPREQAPFGKMEVRYDIPSNEGPFMTRPEYVTELPDEYKDALARNMDRYDEARKALIERNMERPETDYRYMRVRRPDGSIRYITSGIQIDMQGMTQEEIRDAHGMTREAADARIAGKLFENEDSMAGLPIIQGNFAELITSHPNLDRAKAKMKNKAEAQRDARRASEAQKRGVTIAELGEPEPVPEPEFRKITHFQKEWRRFLNETRQRTGKKIAVLAVTQDKLAGLKGFELNRQPDEAVTTQEMRRVTGFDALMGPDEFKALVEEYSQEVPEGEIPDLPYVFYVRSSDPVSKLKNPNVAVEHPVLGDAHLRNIVRAHAITANIDNPEWPVGDPRRINDSKETMIEMGTAFPIENFDELITEKFKQFVASQGKRADLIADGGVYSDEFAAYLLSRGVDPETVSQGLAVLRAKPEKGVYGVYGHVRGTVRKSEFRSDVKAGLKKRGRYLLQPELPPAEVADPETGAVRQYIDRHFMVPEVSLYGDVRYRYILGFRTLADPNSKEAHEGRFHGSDQTEWAPVK